MFLSVGLLQVMVFLAIVGAVATVGVFVAARISLDQATTKVRRRMLKPIGDTVVLHEDQALRSAVTDGIEQMRRAGCTYVAAVLSTGHPVAVMVADRTTIGEVTEHPWMSTAVLEFTSVLMDERGLLGTSNSPYHADMWDGEFRQTFPGATVPELLEHHRRALEFLGERGITAGPVQERDVLEVRSRMLARANAGAATADRRRIQAELRRMAARRPGPVGPLRDLPDIPRRLDAFWRLMAPTQSEPRGAIRPPT